MSTTELLRIMDLIKAIEGEMKNPNEDSVAMLGVHGISAASVALQLASQKQGYLMMSDQRKTEEEKFVYEPREDLAEFLKDVVGVCEATRCEYSYLWKEFHYDRKDETKWSWKENLSGISEIVGYIGDMPINVSLSTAIVNGQKILFYDGISQVVDHVMIRKWLEIVLPDTCWAAAERTGRFNHTDATNFCNIIKR